MEIDPDYKMLDDQILKISNFINKLINENPLLKKIDVKHHPRSTSENIELFEKITGESFKKAEAENPLERIENNIRKIIQ